MKDPVQALAAHRAGRYPRLLARVRTRSRARRSAVALYALLVPLAAAASALRGGGVHAVTPLLVAGALAIGQAGWLAVRCRLSSLERLLLVLGLPAAVAVASLGTRGDEALLGVLVVAAAWFAVNLDTRLVPVAVAAEGAAVLAILEHVGSDRPAVDALAWTAALALLSALVRGVSAAQRGAVSELQRSERHLASILQAASAHAFAGEIVGGVYREIYTGPGDDVLLGGPLPPGVSPEDAWEDRVHPEDRGVYRAYDTALLSRSEPVELEYRLIGYDGVERWVFERAIPRLVAPGRIQVEGTVIDVTERRRAADALAAARDEAERRARVDALTGLYNRRHFQEVLAAELERSRRAGETLAILLLDIDHFKTINDRHGHLTGDAALLAVSALITAAVRRYDTVARWGGEEFVVLLPNVPDAAALHRIAEGVRRSVGEALVPAGEAALSLTASVGAALASDPEAGWDALIAAADAALYAAKRAGRDGTRLAPAGSVDARLVRP